MQPTTGWWRQPWREAGFLLKSARPGFWTTTIWFYFLALGGQPVFRTTEFWLGLGLVTFPLGLLIYGWNDLVDTETDRLNPRKDTFLFGARPTPEQRRRLPWWIVAVHVPCAVVLAARIGFVRAALWYGTIVTAVALYNQPPFSWKSRPPLEVLNQAGYLVVFVLAGWLLGLPQLPWPTFVFGALFAMHSHLFGEVMDCEPDRASGRRTTAVVLGVVPTKLVVAALLAFETAWVWHFFHDGVIALFLAASAAWFLADALLFWRGRPYAGWQMRAFFLGWNAVAVLSLPWIWTHATLGRLS
jgi:4-hydroxybenzoate polyprenyltransferase